MKYYNFFYFACVSKGNSFYKGSVYFKNKLFLEVSKCKLTCADVPHE